MGIVAYDQAGYVGSSMSVRASMAYMNGEMPKSKWTKQRMLDAISEYCDMFGMRVDESVAKMRKDELFEEFFEWKGWHHTGKYANRTDFYGLDEVAVCQMGGRL